MVCYMKKDGVGRRNESYQNSGGESKNGLDCVSFNPMMEFYTNQRGQKCALESGMYFIISMSSLSFQGVAQTLSSSCLLCFRNRNFF